MTEPPILELREASMHFQGVIAVDRVSLEIFPGQVLCMLGENGAGKSTVIKMLTGVCRPTLGRVAVDSKPVAFRSPRDARAAGIATVFQEIGTLPLMDLGRNFFLGAEPTVGRGPLRRLDLKYAHRVAVEELRRFGIQRSIEGKQMVGTLSGGERQALAISRAVHFGARVLILDEPTAAMGVRESEIVLRVLSGVRDQGVAILLVTHNPLQAHEIGDRFVIMSHGKLLSTFNRGDLDARGIVEAMAGTDVREAGH